MPTMTRALAVVGVTLAIACAGIALVAVIAACEGQTRLGAEIEDSEVEVASVIDLPSPIRAGVVSVEEALWARRSIRGYSEAPLTLGEVSQILFAAQGTTHAMGWRTAPSAGGTYPLELYVHVGRVEGVRPGSYRYRSIDHTLILLDAEDRRAAIADAAVGQHWIADGAVVLVFSAVFERTTRRYGYRGTQYVHMEAGHASQNVYLQAAALGLGTVAVGAFDDDRVHEICGLPQDEKPLYIMPVGRP